MGFLYCYLGTWYGCCWNNKGQLSAEPEDASWEEFSYEVNVYEGIMYLTFRVKPQTKTKKTKVHQTTDKLIAEQVRIIFQVKTGQKSDGL